MFKEIKVIASFGERTGYQVHASRFFPRLDKLVRDAKGESGTVHISLLDTVSASQLKEFPPRPSILYNVWESTEQPQEFINNLKNYDQLWVASEAQRSWSIAQGIPEEFVKVVPEGVDGDVYKPAEQVAHETFDFITTGQWQPRKSTLEIIQAFQKAFPADQKVRLYLSVDTLFPSDNYGSTEERLVAYGINDPRIIPVHFEEREAYVRRLQSADCFVSCARSEGWGQCIADAIACGIPTIVSDWGGSTEYHRGAITVPIRKLIKPFGIYGNWDVPGQWCEPDFDVLVEKMRDVYANYKSHKEQALVLSEKIRKDFSWDKAAEKGFNVLKELYDNLTLEQKFGKVVEGCPAPTVTEADIRKYAAERGFKINGPIVEEKCIFAVGTWPNSSAKMETLRETIKQIKMLNFPVLITTHYPIPPHIVEEVDYVVYDKNNVLSGDWRATYGRTGQNGAREEKKCRIPYHGVACLNSIRNAVEFCHDKFDRMYYLEYDSEVDLEKFVEEVRATAEPFTGVKYEGDRGLRTDLWSGELKWLYKNIPVVNTWEEYKAGYTEDEFNNEYPLEMWMKKRLQAVTDQMHLIDFEITNRFDQVDREIWDDDVFRVHFYDGPFMLIDGLSRREYDVVYKAGGKPIYALKQKVGVWSRPDTKFYLPWEITASIDGVEKFKHTLNLKGQRVLIQMASKALGDTIAWMPYVEEFRKIHECHVMCSGWWQEIFDYPEIEWIKPGSEVKNVNASYQIGCFDEQPNMNPTDWRLCPLQKVASDILGIPYRPLKAKLKRFDADAPSLANYVTFSEFSTMKNKMWNREGAWQKVIDHCDKLGHDCVSVSAEPSQLTKVIKHNGQTIQRTIEDIRGSKFYIGLNHGPAWIAYALGVPCIMITGVSQEWNDFPNPYRIAINEKVCGVGCFNDPSLKIDRGWNWCPREKDFICTKEITEELVFEKIAEIGGCHESAQKRPKQKSDQRKHQRIDAQRETATPSSGDRYGVCTEI